MTHTQPSPFYQSVLAHTHVTNNLKHKFTWPKASLNKATQLSLREMDNYFCNNQGITLVFTKFFPLKAYSILPYPHTRTESLIPGVSGP